MDRLISEQKVLDILPKYRLEESTIAEEIKAIPSAEPKTGHWVLGICDNCGYDWSKDAPIASVPNYCPKCGAKMQTESDIKQGLNYADEDTLMPAT